jgi:hypothetical protein
MTNKFLSKGTRFRPEPVSYLRLAPPNYLKNLRGILVSTRSSIEIRTAARKASISAVPAVPAVPANHHITAKTFNRPSPYGNALLHIVGPPLLSLRGEKG